MQITTPAQKMAYTLGYLWKELVDNKIIHPKVIFLPDKSKYTTKDFKLLFNDMMDKYIRKRKRFFDKQFKIVAECITSSELKEEDNLEAYFAMGQLHKRQKGEPLFKGED